MDTTFLFENNATTNTTSKLASNDSANRRFKFKPISEQTGAPFGQKHAQDIQLRLNLNNKKEFQKKLLNFDLNRNFEDIYWLSLKQEKPKFSSFYDKNFPKRQPLFASSTNANSNPNSINQDFTINNNTISNIQIQPQPQSQPQQQQPAPLLLPPQQQTKNNSGDLSTSKQKKKKFNLNDTVSNTAAVLVDLNRQSINLPLTPIKDDLFKNRYFENYLLNRKLTNNFNTTTNSNNNNSFNNSSSNQLNTICFKANFNEQQPSAHQQESLPVINASNSNTNTSSTNESTSSIKFSKINQPIKLEVLEGCRINLRSEEISPRKLISNFTNTSSTINMLPATVPTNTNQFGSSSQNLLSSKILYKIKEDENLSEHHYQLQQSKQEDKKPILGLNREEPIQTQFRLKPLINNINNTNSTISNSSTINSTNATAKPIILNEELSEHEFELYDKNFKKSFPLKTKTKPIKMINQKLPNSSNSEEIANIINANSDLFSAKATSILTTPPLTSSQLTNNTSNAAQQPINSKTKLAKIIKADEDTFLNRKNKNYIYNTTTGKKSNDENSSNSSEEDYTSNSNYIKPYMSKIASNKITNQQQPQPILHYEDFINYTRVESPHKLGKSMPDGYMFVGSSSIQVNSNANTLLNQQFQLFQSQIFDK